MATWALRELMEDPLALSVLGGPRLAVTAEQIRDLYDEIEAEARHAAHGLDADRLPLRLPKSRVTQLLACEAYAVEGRLNRQGDGAQADRLTTAQACGTAADHVVAAWCGGARFGGTVESAAALVEAYRDPSLLHWWHTGEEHEREELAGVLTQVSEGLASGVGPVDPAWLVRTQVPIAASFAGGAVVCEGRFDLELGGRPGELPGAIVDVKTGSHADAARSEHADDLLVYALLASFRDGVAPAWVGTWHATRASLDVHPVGLGALETAAGRLMAAIGQLAELKAGRVPTTRAGRQCQWCELRTTCETFRTSQESGALRGRASSEPAS